MSNSLNQAISEMLDYFSENQWFVKDYWPENEPRVRRLLGDLQRLVPVPASVFEPGCGNGYISFLAGRIGYRVTATDAWAPADREELFRRAGVSCFLSNLNHLEPWPNLPDDKVDAILFGEVFEHLLNHPVGVLRQLHRVLRTGGTLLLTTPNPSTVMNAARILRDQHSLWGTESFASEPKVVEGEIIDKGEIHYREYRRDELCNFLKLAGYQVAYSGYVGTGPTSRETIAKRAGRVCLKFAGLSTARLFSTSNYIIATKS